MRNWYSVIRPLLFHLEPEHAHRIALLALSYTPSFLFPKIETKEAIHAMGLTFPNRIGIAAGLDKNGAYLKALQKLNPGFIEIGTVTPLPQTGNPKPRLFRLQQEEALINRMGFNNEGVEALKENVLASSFKGICGINIGKNRTTPLEKAVDDYVIGLTAVYPLASYVTINISSPNTPGLRELQQPQWLSHLLSELQNTQQSLAKEFGRWVPLCLKISPDEKDDVLKQIAELALKYGISGIIATNTTAKREHVLNSPHAKEEGGLSGQPLFKAALHCIQLLKVEVQNEITLIGSGGISDGSRALEMIDAGATLIQVYSGLIYKGPFLLEEMALALAKRPTTF